MRNVADAAESPRPARRAPTIWTPEQVKLFLASAKESKYYLVYLLAIYCGFRKSEVLGIHCSDVDLKRGAISVNHTVQISKQGVYLADPKTDSSRRTVTVPAAALKELKEYMGRLQGDQPLLFTTSTGRPVAPPNIVKMFKAEAAKAGLPKIRFHDLRHFHATALLLAGASPKQIQDRLGHSQISTTMDIYAHILPSMQEDAAQRFDKVLDLQ